MHYTTEELEQLAIKAIKEHGLINMSEIAAHLPVSRETLYGHELHKFNTIKAAIEEVKTSTATSLRKKWMNSDNATLQVALMKLVATDEDRKRLATSYMETKQNHTNVDLSNLSTDEIIELLKDDEQ